MVGVDVFQEATEDAARADFKPGGDAFGDEAADGLRPEHAAGDLVNEAGAGFGARGDQLGGDVVDEGNGQIAEGDVGEDRGELGLSRLHERAVEGGRDGEGNDPFGAGGLGEFHGAVDGGGVAGDDDLVRRIIVGGGDDFALGSFGEESVQGAFREFEEGGHGADPGGDGLLHELAALADDADGVGKVEGAGGDEGGVFAEGVAGDKVGLEAFAAGDAEGGGGDGDEGGLGVFGLFQLLFGTVEAELADGEAEGLVGFGERGAGFGKRIVKRTAHSGEL